MNEQDKRVIKTRESIEKALFELMRTKSLEKITVVELARTARIHKSTFYLHYLDIPDLYTKPCWGPCGNPSPPRISSRICLTPRSGSCASWWGS